MIHRQGVQERMSEQASDFHSRVADIIEDFADLDARERL